MRTSSRPTALLLFDEVDLLDVALVSSILSSAGRKWNFRPFKILPVAARAVAVDTRSQVKLAAPLELGSVDRAEIVVVPGGYGALRARSDGSLVPWLEAAGRDATDVLALGHGVLLAARAGLLGGTDVALRAESAAELAELSPTCRPHADESFRSSGRITTALSPMGTARATLFLVEKLLGPKHAREIAAELGFPEPGAAPERLEIR